MVFVLDGRCFVLMGKILLFLTDARELTGHIVVGSRKGLLRKMWHLAE